MKCVKFYGDGKVVRCSDAQAELLTCQLWWRDPEQAHYVTKAEWKTGGRLRSGSQDGAPISDHPQKGSPPRHRKKKGKW